MPDYRSISVKVKNYKSFGEDPQGFDHILPINLIIGKNNAGKSALLDAVSHTAYSPETMMPNLGNNGETPGLVVRQPLTDEHIRPVFSENTSGGVIGGNFYEYGKNLIGRPIVMSFPFTSDEGHFLELDPPFSTEAIKNEFAPRLATKVKKPFHGYVVRRIAADRDIRPEPSEDAYSLSPDGTGATNLIRFCLQSADFNGASTYIKKDLLNALNYIFEGETVFTEITTKYRADHWEVYLVEKDKNTEIPISNSGSGLKTILLVLLQLLVMARLVATNGEDHFIFLFEEIENNLHPGLLRNLLNFIRVYAKEKGCLFFITTHSSTTIDLFDKDPDAQIVHVRHNKKHTTVIPTKVFLDKKGVIDDLDVRSSDILQSNAVIWVEGPSDRTYINHWLSLYSNGELREGEHYQCVFYGGRLLARLTADPDAQDEVNILKINTNAILVMDSDIVLPNGTINATKERMKKEVEAVNGYVWTTDGKEIENYLPKELLESHYKKTTTKTFTSRTKIQDFINSIEAKAGDVFVQQKPLFAEQFCELYTKEMLDADKELTVCIKAVHDLLRKWNGIKEPEVS